MNFMAVSSSSLGLALHFNLKRGGTKAQQTVIWAMKLAPIFFFFLRHNTSYLCMQLQSIFFMGASERSEGTIEIHRREGEQAKEDFLADQRENVRHPCIKTQFGLGQNGIQVCGGALPHLTP